MEEKEVKTKEIPTSEIKEQIDENKVDNTSKITEEKRVDDIINKPEGETEIKSEEIIVDNKEKTSEGDKKVDKDVKDTTKTYFEGKIWKHPDCSAGIKTDERAFGRILLKFKASFF